MTLRVGVAVPLVAIGVAILVDALVMLDRAHITCYRSEPGRATSRTTHGWQARRRSFRDRASPSPSPLGVTSADSGTSKPAILSTVYHSFLSGKGSFQGSKGQNGAFRGHLGA
jgi:hypothetical protein